MARFGFPKYKVELDDETPALKDISKYVTTVNGWTKEQILEEITSAGDDDERWAPVLVNRALPVVLTGPYDTVADGLYDVTKDTWANIRTLQQTFDLGVAAHVDIIETYIQSVSVNPARGIFHALVVTLQPTGAVT